MGLWVPERPPGPLFTLFRKGKLKQKKKARRKEGGVGLGGGVERGGGGGVNERTKAVPRGASKCVIIIRFQKRKLCHRLIDIRLQTNRPNRLERRLKFQIERALPLPVER